MATPETKNNGDFHRYLDLALVGKHAGGSIGRVPGDAMVEVEGAWRSLYAG
jgi:hypothetical protein